MKLLKRRKFLKALAGSAGIGTLLLKKGTLSAEYREEQFKITGPEQYSIYIGPETDATVRFAAEELKKYLIKISSLELQINTPPVLGEKNAVIISPAHGGFRNWKQLIKGSENLPDDGFIIRTGNYFAVMAGNNPRGALYGVYGFLEKLGCRFYGLGESGEIIPAMNPLSIPKLDIEEKPAFRWRDWSEDSGYAHRSDNPDHRKRHEKFWLQLTDWCAKNRINMTGNRDYPSMIEAFEKRGIVNWTGGHLIPRLLPRSLFDTNPDYFRMDPTGKRMPNGNFCASNKDALALVAENAVTHLKEHPYSHNLEIWGEDVRDGSWCYCPECSRMTVQDQYLTVCNAVAKKVKEAGYTIDIDAIAYHDSIEPDVTITPEPNLKMMWAPRERSYGHALNDMGSDRNQWYRECFEKWAEIFGPKNMDLFEYYNDNILFRTFPISCPHLIAGDVQYYTDTGLDNHYLLCHLGDYAFQSEPLSCYVYVRMIYNRDQDVDEIIAEYCRDMYGRAASTMHKWHDDFEEAMRYCATFGDIQQVPTECSPRTEKLITEISKSLKLVKEARMLVKRAKSETSDKLQKQRINTQDWVNEFAVLMVSGLLHQVTGEYYFGRIKQIIWGRKARKQDPYRGLEGRYTQVCEEYQKAIDYYEKSSAFLEALPVEEHSVWCETATLRHNKGICDEMRAKIAECKKHT